MLATRPLSTRSNAIVATIRIATVGTFATWWPLAIRARDCADRAPDQLGTHLCITGQQLFFAASPVPILILRPRELSE
jgi:hypothetical protein